MMYIVTSQGKSGSTLLTQMLHESGIQMFTKNCNFNEERSFADILRKITWQNETRMFEISDEINLFEYSWLKDDIDNAISKYTSQDFGFKNPLTIHCYSLLRKYLPHHKIIHIYRDPREIYEYRINGENILRGWLYIQDQAEQIADLMIDYNNIDIDSISDLIERPIKNLFDDSKRHRKPALYANSNLLNVCYNKYLELGEKYAKI